MPEAKALLLPVVALVAWSHLIWVWMYATRLPAMAKAKLRLDPSAVRGAQMATLPAEVRWKADNYNHLMEQPTLFYALALAMSVGNLATSLDVTLAWGYVGLRVIHSLVQSTFNKIEVRFTFFALSSIALMVLTVRALLALLALPA